MRRLTNCALQTAKRDYLKGLERKYQERWASERLFETDAPREEGVSAEELQKKYPKWFGNFPYPYMNGSLHLGHGFTISKVEFAAGYERMLGKRVLFPHGFHCTGMPIKVCPMWPLSWNGWSHVAHVVCRLRRTRSFGRSRCLARISRGSRRRSRKRVAT